MSDEAPMTGDNILDKWRGVPRSPKEKSFRTMADPVRRLRGQTLLVTVCLFVALGGCVNTKPGDFNAPEPPADRRPF
jgi:hypothetical protein